MDLITREEYEAAKADATDPNSAWVLRQYEQQSPKTAISGLPQPDMERAALKAQPAPATMQAGVAKPKKGGVESLLSDTLEDPAALGATLTSVVAAPFTAGMSLVPGVALRAALQAAGGEAGAALAEGDDYKFSPKRAAVSAGLGAAGELIPTAVGKAAGKVGEFVSPKLATLKALLGRSANYLGGTSKGQALAARPAAAREGQLSLSKPATEQLIQRTGEGTFTPTASAMAEETAAKTSDLAAAERANQAATERHAAQVAALARSDAEAATIYAQKQSERQSAQQGLAAAEADLTAQKPPPAYDEAALMRSAELSRAAKEAGAGADTYMSDVADLQSRVPPDVASRVPESDVASYPEMLASVLKRHSEEVQALGKRGAEQAKFAAQEKLLGDRLATAQLGAPEAEAVFGTSATPEELAAFGDARAAQSRELTPITRKAQAGTEAEPLLNEQHAQQGRVALQANKAHAKQVDRAARVYLAVPPPPTPPPPAPGTTPPAPMPATSGPVPALELLQSGFTDASRTLPFAADRGARASGSKLAKISAEMGVTGEALHGARTAQANALLEGAPLSGDLTVAEARQAALRDTGRRLADEQAALRAKLDPTVKAPADAVMQSGQSDALAGQAEALAARRAAAKKAIDAAEAAGVDFSMDYPARLAGDRLAAEQAKSSTARAQASVAAARALLDKRPAPVQPQPSPAPAAPTPLKGGSIPTFEELRDAESLRRFAQTHGDVPAAGALPHTKYGMGAKAFDLLRGKPSAANAVGSEAYRHGLQSQLASPLREMLERANNNPVALKTLLHWLAQPPARRTLGVSDASTDR